MDGGVYAVSHSSSLVSFFALADQELDFCLDTPYSECNILRSFGLVFRAGTSRSLVGCL